ncbi:hypothetical protein M378DRAFT_360126 [Amanita muscaria Koide BX008]|uniref:Uncharacterized protein n=1 Tax=Amanita muscaria (strain Koide BX008) TaxID=946122 RepID=A0A0C2S545_AMAMK|nr:hypothetical protein M378DRAFT_360126 [Amanita muscaria Koide BX008]
MTFTHFSQRLEIARTIRYIHSMAIALFSRIIEPKRFGLDSNLRGRAKVLFIGLFAWWPREVSIYGHENSDHLAESTYESNITTFADLFHSICFGLQ